MTSSSLLPAAADIEGLYEGLVIRHENVWYQAVKVQPRPGQHKQLHWQALPSIAPVEALGTQVDFGTGAQFPEGKLAKLWTVTSSNSGGSGPIEVMGVARGQGGGGRGSAMAARRGRGAAAGRRGGMGGTSVTLLEDSSVSSTMMTPGEPGTSSMRSSAAVAPTVLNGRFTTLTNHNAAAAARPASTSAGSSASAAAQPMGHFTADAIRRPDFAYARYPVLYSIRCRGELAPAATAVCIEAGDCPDTVLIQRHDTGCWYQPLKNSNGVSHWKLVTPPKIDASTGKSLVSGLLEATPPHGSSPIYFLIQTLH